MSLRSPAIFIDLFSFPNTSTAASRDRPSAGVSLWVLLLSILNHLSGSRGSVGVSIVPLEVHKTPFQFVSARDSDATPTSHSYYRALEGTGCHLVVGLMNLWSVE
jgi:hypothetical protein